MYSLLENCDLTGQPRAIVKDTYLYIIIEYQSIAKHLAISINYWAFISQHVYVHIC